MGLLIRRRYDLEVAHRLSRGVPEHHKCRRLHGHRYEVAVSVGGEPDDDGILIEYDALDRVIWPVFRLVDHHCLNDLAERCSTSAAALVSDNPTVERLVAWMATRLDGIVASSVAGRRLALREIRVDEDRLSAAVWVP
jgi:6-pyruvoyltetrahydropterin/6-carboxytetrahydropterin synthase